MIESYRHGSYSVLEGLKDNLDLTMAANFSSFDWDLEKLIILVFIKLKLNLSFATMATLFRKTYHTTSKNFFFILPFLKSALSVSVYWPSKEEAIYRRVFNNLNRHLDCFETKIPTLKCLTCRTLTYSQYKGCQTIKFLVGVTPAGMVSYLSKAYRGRASDKLTFNQENLLTRFEIIPGVDSIMVDKGFFY